MLFCHSETEQSVVSIVIPDAQRGMHWSLSLHLSYFCGMPQILQRDVFEGSKLGVWKITEPPEFFTTQLNLTPNEQATVDRLPPLRQREWLASRNLLKVLIGLDESLEIASHPTGKPYLIGRTDEISLSHSADCVAVMLGQAMVGVDIQICKEKIVTLEHKFARPEEQACIDRRDVVRHLHLLWGAKEALYKIYARKQLHFLTHLHVDLPAAVQTSGHFSGEIRIAEQTLPCTLRYEILEDYVLVYGQRLG